jgi:O-antigen biosynthesis protein WbqP
MIWSQHDLSTLYDRPERARVNRAADLALALPLLVLTSPVVAVAALAIRLTSEGPALFSQVRVGRGEISFRCRKLRTMVVGTAAGATHEIPKSAVTPIGRILRRYKIDELPQLWNVLAGEMSLIGPRPCLPQQDRLVELRRKLDVYSIRPGITGLAQVRGIDMSHPAACAAADAEYLRTATPGLDAVILLRTVLPSLRR